MQTHLEPLERPLRAVPGDAAGDAAAIAQIQELVQLRTGGPARASGCSAPTGDVSSSSHWRGAMASR